MLKRDFFIKALNAGTGKKRAWVNSVFSLVIGHAPGFKDTPYWYKVRVIEGEMSFLDPNHDMIVHADPELGGAGPEQPAWTVIEDYENGKALFEWKDPLTIAPGEVANYQGNGLLETTYGNAFFNYMALVLPFGKTLPYMTGQIDVKDIEKEIVGRLIDDPVDEDIPAHRPDLLPMAPDGQIYARQYLHFCDNALSLMAYATSIVASASRKSMVAHPDRTAVRNMLVEKYKDQLNDPATVAKIGKALEELDREWLKGDASEGFYKSDASKFFGGTRKRMFYMFGGESPFEDGTQVQFIQKSLEEGIDTDHMEVMNNSTRFGSYNRGAQTKLGGESTKTIYRMLGTVRISMPDCGTAVGVPVTVNNFSAAAITGFTILKGTENVLLTPENINSYMGRTVFVRGPGVCKAEGKNCCAVCAGRALSEQPNGLAAASAGLGGRFLSLFLKKMHAGALKTTRWNWRALLK